MDNRFDSELSKKQILLGYLCILPLNIIGGVFIAVFLLSFITSVFHLDIPEESMVAYINLIVPILVLLLILIFYYRYFKESLFAFKKDFKWKLLWISTIGLAITYGGNIFSQMILNYLKAGTTSNNQSLIIDMMKTHPIIMGVTAIILAPIVEETIFRGIIFSSLKKINMNFALIVSSLLFGFLHVYQSVIFDQNFSELIQMLPYSMIGVSLGYCYIRNKNIIAPIILHSLMNAISFCLLLFMQNIS